MIKAVVIDFDDTLCLTEAICFELENAVLAKMGRSLMSREIHLQTWGRPLFDAIIERSPGIDVEEFRRAYEPTIKEFIDSNQLDAIPTENLTALDAIIEHGYEIMILTSRTYGEAKHMLEPDHLLSSRIKHFYHKDRTKYHKPDPRVFDELLADNSLQPKECVYVGDSVSDAEASKAAGLYFIASLESGLRKEEDFTAGQVDAFIQKFPDLPAAVKRLEA